ncbi:growth-regulating factor 9-like [Rhododendron vialii]|uniref:growth-regulating factor 9-like n=1 Tax=Rhododendron vialii TaxID=182163 RepID=UPI00265E7585|nr:growth-regulating factor 9-like [Rhododendron vialii]
MDPEPGRCRRTDGKKWRCGKDVIPDQKYCERHMHRGRGRSRKLVEASEITSESVPVNLQLATPSPKSSSNNSIGKDSTTSAISSISGSENRIYAKKDSTSAAATATATPTTNGIDKESNKNVYHSKDTTRSMTTTGLWSAVSEKINKCTSDSELLHGKDAGYKHLNNRININRINIRGSNNNRHAGDAGSLVASRLGFSPDSVLQVVGCSSSCLNYRNDVETELQRCRRTDGKKWRCGADVVPDQKYCERHLHRGSKKLAVVAEPVRVTSALLPLGIYHATSLAIPQKESGYINLNTDLSISITASPQQMANEEKSNTSSSSDANNISDENGSVSHLLALSP